MRDLVADKAVSQKDYDDALSMMELEEAAVQQATAKVNEAKLNLSYTLVSAPVAGISGRAARSEGTLITTDASPLPVHVLPTDEERMIARHTLRVLRQHR